MRYLNWLIKKQSHDGTQLCDKIIQTIDTIANISKNQEGSSLFERMVMSLSDLTGSTVVIIGKYRPEDNSVDTLGYFNKGKVRPNFNYALENSPCSNVIGKQTCVYKNDVFNLFPKDPFLYENKIETYIGVPLFYSELNALGLMVVMFDSVVENSIPIELVLKLYSVKVVAEVEYLEYKQDVDQKEKEISSVLEQLKLKNIELDASIHELKEARRHAEESNNLKTAFLANLSHEVRTPMNVMLGFAELLKSEMVTHEERVEYIDIINQNGFQLLKIMDNLLEVSKFQSKRLTQNVKPVNINSIINRCYGNYSDYLRLMQKDVELIVHRDFADGADYVYADQEGVYKILDQLIDNAVKFTKSGSIRIGYRKIKQMLRFEVIDTGIGIPEGMEETVFDLFRQVDLRASREFGGNGLGLAIARKYSELLHGRLWTEHNPIGGTCFYFEIPYRIAKLDENQLSIRN